MKKSVKSHIYNFLVLASLLFTDEVYSDSFEHNLYNNYGIVGLIHTPTARSYDEGVHGITLYDGTPNQTVTLSANPFDWMEASFSILMLTADLTVMKSLMWFVSKTLKIKVSISN